MDVFDSGHQNVESLLQIHIQVAGHCFVFFDLLQITLQFPNSFAFLFSPTLLLTLSLSEYFLLLFDAEFKIIFNRAILGLLVEILILHDLALLYEEIHLALELPRLLAFLPDLLMKSEAVGFLEDFHYFPLQLDILLHFLLQEFLQLCQFFPVLRKKVSFLLNQTPLILAVAYGLFLDEQELLVFLQLVLQLLVFLGNPQQLVQV